MTDEEIVQDWEDYLTDEPLEAYKKKDIKYSATQQGVIDRYIEATKSCPEGRMPLIKLVGMKNRIRRVRPDIALLEMCEMKFLSKPTGVMGRPKRQLDNSFVRSVFYMYEDYYEARKQFYWLDDIIVGVSRLDMGGNTRPLSVSILYNFVRTSNIVNTSIISDYCDVGPRQAQKIMVAVILIHRMIEKELRRLGFEDT